MLRRLLSSRDPQAGAQILHDLLARAGLPAAAPADRLILDFGINLQPARISRKSGSRMSAPCCAMRLATLSRPRRSHFEHVTSSIGSLPATSPSVTAVVAH